jgi:hypothetical protein
MPRLAHFFYEKNSNAKIGYAWMLERCQTSRQTTKGYTFFLEILSVGLKI